MGDLPAQAPEPQVASYHDAQFSTGVQESTSSESSYEDSIFTDEENLNPIIPHDAEHPFNTVLKKIGKQDDEEDRERYSKAVSHGHGTPSFPGIS